LHHHQHHHANCLIQKICIVENIKNLWKRYFCGFLRTEKDSSFRRRNQIWSCLHTLFPIRIFTVCAFTDIADIFPRKVSWKNEHPRLLVCLFLWCSLMVYYVICHTHVCSDNIVCSAHFRQKSEFHARCIELNW
jgi:hypothetical protein